MYRRSLRFGYKDLEKMKKIEFTKREKKGYFFSVLMDRSPNPKKGKLTVVTFNIGTNFTMSLKRITILGVFCVKIL